MTKKEADSLKNGDVVYCIRCDSGGTKISLDSYGTLYIRGEHHGRRLVSHSPKWNTACWPVDDELFLQAHLCLLGGIENAMREVAVAVLMQRYNAAKVKLKEAQAEFDLIAGTTPGSLIDQQSIKDVIDNTTRLIRENPITS